ncbi:MAG: hypothetical protein F6K36_10805 [Symploca sp. SIO3C6]|uniref:Uncharacterized protein n=1 Tax=Symploca sp. SIO1C4 TaxID=2607765 RepID=A0A6B3N6N1_9CYAN|nr:hypothetical protein [Symploca sp. SIO3C6]NER26455.1 hypothetical protein [Symploca sp. SIO1C4]NET08612.1 hypothetical protein [Symploca sp. SIO2B6]NET47452.1 hypothetical protein [Merismopedia sp. SIO2A8]
MPIKYSTEEKKMAECLLPKNQVDKKHDTKTHVNLQVENKYYEIVNWNKDDKGECHIKGELRFYNESSKQVVLHDISANLDLDDMAECYDVHFLHPDVSYIFWSAPDKKTIKGPSALAPGEYSCWYSYYLVLNHNHGFPEKQEDFPFKILCAPHYRVEFTTGDAFASEARGVIH